MAQVRIIMPLKRGGGGGGETRRIGGRRIKLREGLPNQKEEFMTLSGGEPQKSHFYRPGFSENPLLRALACTCLSDGVFIENLCGG